MRKGGGGKERRGQQQQQQPSVTAAEAAAAAAFEGRVEALFFERKVFILLRAACASYATGPQCERE